MLIYTGTTLGVFMVGGLGGALFEGRLYLPQVTSSEYERDKSSAQLYRDRPTFVLESLMP